MIACPDVYATEVQSERMYYLNHLTLFAVLELSKNSSVSASPGGRGGRGGARGDPDGGATFPDRGAQFYMPR